MRQRPLPTQNSEINSFISLVPDGDIEELLREQRTKTLSLLSKVTEDTASKAYAPGKWTLKEVIGHMTDSERVMSYRVLAIARNETSSLPAMDQNQYVSQANFNNYSWEQLLAGLDATRSNTLCLISTIDDTAWLRTGTVMNSSISLATLVYGMAGHELHHMNVIRERYL